MPAITTLALGIGATAAISSFVNALLLRPFPFPEPDALVQIHSEALGQRGQLSSREVEDLQQRSRLFEGFVGYSDTAAYNFAGGDGPPIEIPATIATHNLFDLLGAAPVLGESWPASSDRQRSFDIVISHSLWTERFRSDPEIVGKQLQMDAAPYTIMGVAPPDFHFPSNAGLFRCQGILTPEYYAQRENRNRQVLARIKPGVGLEAARREAAAISEQLAREFPETNADVRFVVTPLREKYLGDSTPYLITLLGAVGFVLLVACINVVNLMLARATARARETAVRSALGAGRWRLAQQPLAESLLLAVAGGLGGLALTYVFVGAMSQWVRADLPAWMEIRVDLQALLFLAAATLGVGLITGVLPALLTSRAGGLVEALKEGSRGATGRHGLNQALVVTETSAALVLLIGAALLLQSFARLRTTDVGFDAANTLTFRTALPWKTYDEQRTWDFYRRVLERLRQIPGVEAAELNSSMPLTGSASQVPVAREGQSKAEWVRNPEPRYYHVTPGFHDAFQAPLVSGRFLADNDDSRGRSVCLVSKRAAELFWPGENPIGKKLKPQPGQPSSEWMEVVGVVGDVKHDSPDESPTMAVYAPFFQHLERNAYIVLKTSVDPLSVLDAATAAVWSVDPEQSVFDAATMDDHIHDLIWQRSIAGRLFGVFAALALILASIGLYGVISYRVAERTREMGVRAAIGARPIDLIRLVVGQGLALVLTGVVIGGVAGLALARAMEGLLYGVKATDPMTFAVMPAALIVVGALASYIPALRASRVDPADALRDG